MRKTWCIKVDSIMHANTSEEALGQIRQIHSRLQRNKSSKKNVRNNVWKLERLLLNDRLSSEEQEKAIKRRELKRILPALQSFYEKFEVDLEYNFVSNLLADKKVRLSQYELYQRFVVLVKNEIRLANISRDDNVLFIGSGPLPITALLLHKFAGCHVDCYDRDRKAAITSIDVARRLGSSGIHIFNEHGESLASNQYSAIVIALLAKPKGKILRRLWKICRSGTRIVCRTSDGIRQVFYETTDPVLFRKYGQAAKVYAKGDQTISSVLLVKS